MTKRERRETESARKFLDTILRDPAVKARASAEYLETLRNCLDALTKKLTS